MSIREKRCIILKFLKKNTMKKKTNNKKKNTDNKKKNSLNSLLSNLNLTASQKQIVIVLGSLCCILLLILCIFGIRALLSGGTKKEVHKIDPAESVEPVETEDTIVPFDQEYTVLKMTEDAGREYVDETLFLGDSNTVRMMNFLADDGKPFTTNQNTIAVSGMGMEQIASLACEQLSTGTVTMPTAVSQLQPKRIIITFGTNNLRGTDLAYFKNGYTSMIKTIENAYPYADIIVQSVFPLGQYGNYPNLSMSTVKGFNKVIQEMCEENKWRYLNTYNTLINPKTGYIKAEYIIEDGLHLTQKGLQAVFDYIRTHAYIGKDRRPKPLNWMPTIYGPLTDMLRKDPLKDDATPSPTPSASASPSASPSPTTSPTPTPTVMPETVTPTEDTSGQPEEPVPADPTSTPEVPEVPETNEGNSEAGNPA